MSLKSMKNIHKKFSFMVRNFIYFSSFQGLQRETSGMKLADKSASIRLKKV